MKVHTKKSKQDIFQHKNSQKGSDASKYFPSIYRQELDKTQTLNQGDVATKYDFITINHRGHLSLENGPIDTNYSGYLLVLDTRSLSANQFNKLFEEVKLKLNSIKIQKQLLKLPAGEQNTGIQAEDLIGMAFELKIRGHKVFGELKNAEQKGNSKKKKKPNDFSINGIKQVMQEKGYEFYEEEGKVNLIAVRMDNIFDNKFSDKLFIIQKIDGKSIKTELPWTTLAGTLGHGGALDPLSAKETGTGASGVAVVLEGQYKNVYSFYDTYKGWLKYPYLQQVDNMNYYRDANKDTTVDKGTVYAGNYGTNVHRMTNNGMLSEYVNYKTVSWSQGCQGTPEPEFKKLLPFLRTHVKNKHGKISYTILSAKDFL